ncbi:MAG TPA: hypothetical protein DCR55_05025 [Lentisphaeria bacterium]|nr:hypothetical protein [Lentisphaeria bacterium]
MERVLCPGVRFKSGIVDGYLAYSSSANITGGGMGAKCVDKCNFENGILTDDPSLIRQIMDQFDAV